MADLLIVDDDSLFISNLEDRASNLGLEVVSKTSGHRGFYYLHECAPRELPRAYLVDMRLPGELAKSEEIFYYLREMGQIDYFRFMTGNLSDHDAGVIERTRAKSIIKGDHKAFQEFFEELKRTKPTS